MPVRILKILFPDQIFLLFLPSLSSALPGILLNITLVKTRYTIDRISCNYLKNFFRYKGPVTGYFY
jgi:hypothetical protein